jgi:type IV pilus assembly protein PilE
MTTSHERGRGFTLIELMVVMIVLAILITLAMPSYQRYVMRGHRSAAQSAMMDIASREQQFLLANRSYVDGTELAASGYSLPPDVTDRYTMSLTVGTAAVPSFLITLTPTGPQSSDGALTLDNLGNKAPVDKWKGR